MKIALTGTSSTGKTTLAQEFLHRRKSSMVEYSFLTADARKLLRALGFSSMDRMTPAERIKFQQLYLAEKERAEVTYKGNYITDRSFVDVAAYWMVRDSPYTPSSIKFSLGDRILNRCKQLASLYDIHFYLPWGLIPFESDGYRSDNLTFHKEIDDCIFSLLCDWRVKHIRLNTASLEERLSVVEEYTQRHL